MSPGLLFLSYEQMWIMTEHQFAENGLKFVILLKTKIKRIKYGTTIY
jgi:hypothetical protein